ncbi:MAG TPA: BrnA antitoxin family protein [Gammaproteobacteria bacterium]|nr:BrnA antitoxin family protein [Gammaproteobacteria bacterium]
MKQRSSSKPSRSISRRRGPSPKVKLTAEHPELDPKHVVRVIVRNGLKVVRPKATISLRVDADVLEWFRASGAGYQTRMNAVLRAYKEASV